MTRARRPGWNLRLCNGPSRDSQDTHGVQAVLVPPPVCRFAELAEFRISRIAILPRATVPTCRGLWWRCETVLCRSTDMNFEPSVLVGSGAMSPSRRQKEQPT